MYTIDVFEPLSRVLDDIKDKPIYITLDIDVVDPAYANVLVHRSPAGSAPGNFWIQYICSREQILSDLTL